MAGLFVKAFERWNEATLTSSDCSPRSFYFKMSSRNSSLSPQTLPVKRGSLTSVIMKSSSKEHRYFSE